VPETIVFQALFSQRKVFNLFKWQNKSFFEKYLAVLSKIKVRLHSKTLIRAFFLMISYSGAAKNSIIKTINLGV